MRSSETVASHWYLYDRGNSVGISETSQGLVDLDTLPVALLVMPAKQERGATGTKAQ
jgi:hypothetical protein